MKLEQGFVHEQGTYVLKTAADGSQVTTADLHVIILKMMDEIHRVCVKNDIPYALMAGSALGIYNYHGFIPWDDDVDVFIHRKDWDRFVKALKNDLSDDYVFQCFETDKRYNVMIPPMKIRARHTYIEEVNILLKNRCSTSDGVYIDIDMFDDVSENKYIDELFRAPIRLMMPLMVLLDNIGCNATWLKKASIAWANFYSTLNRKSRYVFETISIPWERFLKEPVFLKEDVYPFCLYDFEGRQFYSFNNVKNILIARYGERALRRFNGTEWIDPYPPERRVAKHVRDIRLKD